MGIYKNWQKHLLEQMPKMPNMRCRFVAQPESLDLSKYDILSSNYFNALSTEQLLSLKDRYEALLNEKDSQFSHMFSSWVSGLGMLNTILLERSQPSLFNNN